MSKTAGLEKLRPCGITTTDVSPIELKGFIWQALHKVIARHPALSIIVLKEDQQDAEVHFARLPSIDLETCVEFIEHKHVVTAGDRDEELELLLQDQHRINFRDDIGSRPFWRLLILQNPGNQSTFTAAWFFHHALGDGGCGPIFHRTFLEALRSNASLPPGTELTSTVTPPSTPLLPKFEDLHPHPLSWPFFLRAILGSIFPSFFDPRAPKLWTGPPVTAPNPLPGSKVQLLPLSASITTHLLKLSRENNTTMQATLECCIASALFSVLPAERYDKVIASSPISLRFILQHEGKPIGNDDFVLALADYSHTHTRASHPSSNEKFPWEEARAVRATIQAKVAKKGADNAVSLLRYVSDMHKFFTEKVGQERKVSFELSNLGLVRAEAGTENEWKLGRCVFSQSPNVTGPPICCSVVTGGDGCCVLAFSWLEGVVEDEMVTAVVDGVEKQIQCLLGEKD
ncbi:Alcohol acetyltransferase [Didymosphaeria variabile]|uniref:Alcohol acetyltransferase n=1 Tax=Didymosphaeria variabile TaxID=1932322 RepID=A0A9W8XSB1_9PLEO|nr:Alcohol acetyltransferase [Didymosphaeria variabile]KAJ4356478.1 Alcohol acetyltransferase [Didymosphaeria variabile]